MSPTPAATASRTNTTFSGVFSSRLVPSPIRASGVSPSVSVAMAVTLLRAARSLANARAAVVAPPAKAGLVRLRRKRRARKLAGGKLQVVLDGGEVVRTIGMEQRSQVLKLPTSRTLLEHAPAVRADAARGAVVVGVEKPANAAEAGRLEVEHARWPWQCLDIRDRVDRLVPRDPVPVLVEQPDRVVDHRGVLDPCRRQPLEHAPE